MQNLAIRTAILVVVVAAFAAATLLAMGCGSGESETERIYREYANAEIRPTWIYGRSRASPSWTDRRRPRPEALAKCLAKEGR